MIEDGFNCGSIHQVSSAKLAQIASLTAVTTTLGASSGAVSALWCSAIISRRQTGETSFDLSDTLNGCLAGLVSSKLGASSFLASLFTHYDTQKLTHIARLIVTAGCGLIEPWAAALIGSIGGIVYLITGSLLVKFKIDDAVEAIPVHLGPGIWGVISVGLFASPRFLKQIYGHNDHPGFFYSFTHGGADAYLLAANLVGLLFIIAWVLALMLPFFLMLSYLGWFRTDSLEEIIGLDPGGCEPDSVTRQHLDILKRQINAREGIINEEEGRTLVNSRKGDSFNENP